MSNLFRGFVIALTLGCMAVGSQAAAQTKPKVTSLGPDYPKTAIFIGNSFFYYNNGLPGHVSLLEKAADPEHKQAYRNTMVTIGGSGFDWHDVESYFRPNAVGKYSFDDNNVVVFNKPGRLLDAAVMMDCRQCPVHPTLRPVFTEYAKKDAEIVRAHGTRPLPAPTTSHLVRASPRRPSPMRAVRRRNCCGRRQCSGCREWRLAVLPPRMQRSWSRPAPTWSR